MVVLFSGADDLQESVQGESVMVQEEIVVDVTHLVAFLVRPRVPWVRWRRIVCCFQGVKGREEIAAVISLGAFWIYRSTF